MSSSTISVNFHAHSGELHATARDLDRKAGSVTIRAHDGYGGTQCVTFFVHCFEHAERYADAIQAVTDDIAEMNARRREAEKAPDLLLRSLSAA